MKPNHSIFLSILLFAILGGIVSPLWGADQASVNFIPHWLPQAEFAGYYCALTQGFYSQRNIDLHILTGGPNHPSSAELEKGSVDFASLWLTNALQLRARGVRVFNIAQWINRSALMFITRKSSGIQTPQDMNGKKVGIWGGDSQIQTMAFLKKYNLDVRILQQPNSINLFLDRGIDVTSAMWYNEYHTILNAGLDPEELQTFRLADHDLNFPEEGVYCLESTLVNRPDLCRDFILASLEGWQYAFLHPEEAIEVVSAFAKEARIPCNRSHQRWMLERMKDLMIAPGTDRTRSATSRKEYEIRPLLSRKDYDFVCEKMKEYGLITTSPVYDDFFKTVFLTQY